MSKKLNLIEPSCHRYHLDFVHHTTNFTSLFLFFCKDHFVTVPLLCIMYKCFFWVILLNFTHDCQLSISVLLALTTFIVLGKEKKLNRFSLPFGNTKSLIIPHFVKKKLIRFLNTFNSVLLSFIKYAVTNAQINKSKHKLY